MRANAENLQDDEIWEIWLTAGKLEWIVDQAIATTEPAYLAKYAFQLAQQFNNFYHKHHILHEENAERKQFLMTTAATVVGHFPLVLATGPGAGARNSIGIMLVSGMIIGTLFTLFVVPSIYMLIAKDHHADGEMIQSERDHLSATPSDSALDPAASGM